MNPQVKLLSIILGSIAGVFIVPTVLVIFHDYINAFFAITLFIANFMLFGYYSYIEFYPIMLKKHLEEEDIIHQFHGDKQKIKFYKGFKKHFDGSLSVEGLEKWFENHH